MITPLLEGVHFSGGSLDLLRMAVRDAQRYRARNGLGPLRAYDQLAELLAPAVAVSAVGQSDSPPEPIGEPDVMTTKEAAEAMRVTERTARRKAPALGGRHTAGVWMLDRAAVMEHVEGTRALEAERTQR